MASEGSTLKRSWSSSSSFLLWRLFLTSLVAWWMYPAPRRGRGFGHPAGGRAKKKRACAVMKTLPICWYFYPAFPPCLWVILSCCTGHGLRCMLRFCTPGPKEKAQFRRVVLNHQLMGRRNKKLQKRRKQRELWFVALFLVFSRQFLLLLMRQEIKKGPESVFHIPLSSSSSFVHGSYATILFVHFFALLFCGN